MRCHVRFSISYLPRSVLLIFKILSLYGKISVILLLYPQRYTSPSLLRAEHAFPRPFTHWLYCLHCHLALVADKLPVLCHCSSLIL